MRISDYLFLWVRLGTCYGDHSDQSSKGLMSEPLMYNKLNTSTA
jgi:hypothetical protein